MSYEVMMGIMVALVLIVTIGIKVIIQKVLTFKMDESAIVKFIAESGEESGYRTTEAISAATDISADRVCLVCSKSKLIRRNSKGKELWCVH